MALFFVGAMIHVNSLVMCLIAAMVIAKLQLQLLASAMQ
jgi:hypothetical protein